MMRLSAFAGEISLDLDEGFFSLEPYLAAARQFRGFSGPDLFARASQALQGMLRDMGWEYE